jgi:dihydrofolate reductase
MQLSLVVAMDESRAIGQQNRLPWRLSDDLRRFKALTTGHHIIMGRKTHESIGRPLPGRVNLVITRQADYRAEGCTVVHSLPTALQLAAQAGETEAFVIGGAQLFHLALPLADRLYLTRVHTIIPGADVFFPPFDLSDWRLLAAELHPADERNEFSFTFQTLERA